MDDGGMRFHQYSVELRPFYKMRRSFLPTLSVLWLFLSAMILAEDSSPVACGKRSTTNTHASRDRADYEENGEYFGKIESSFNPAERTKKCSKCPGDRRDQPIIGLVILRGMMKRGSEYSGGEILDPETGEVYKCVLRLSATAICCWCGVISWFRWSGAPRFGCVNLE